MSLWNRLHADEVKLYMKNACICDIGDLMFEGKVQMRQKQNRKKYNNFNNDWIITSILLTELAVGPVDKTRNGYPFYYTYDFEIAYMVKKWLRELGCICNLIVEGRSKRQQ